MAAAAGATGTTADSIEFHLLSATIPPFEKLLGFRYADLVHFIANLEQRVIVDVQILVTLPFLDYGAAHFESAAFGGGEFLGVFAPEGAAHLEAGVVDKLNVASLAVFRFFESISKGLSHSGSLILKSTPKFQVF